jgi:hypothetical protein
LDRYALLGAALVACDPILLNQSTLVMTETLAAFLAALVLVLLTAVVERGSIRLAVLAGLAVPADVYGHARARAAGGPVARAHIQTRSASEGVESRVRRDGTRTDSLACASG